MIRKQLRFMNVIFRLLVALLCAFIFDLSHTVSAEIGETEKQVIKQEVINELLQSDLLRQKIKQEIVDYEATRARPKLVRASSQRQIDLQGRIQRLLRPIAFDRDRIYGNADALVSVIEFADFECPYCRKIYPVLKRLVDDSGGKVNWVFRHFPLSGHKPNAQQEAEAAECAGDLAGQQAFWILANALLLQPRRGVKDGQTIIDRALANTNLDKISMLECANNEKFKAKINSDEEEAIKLGLQGTPANVLINNKTGLILFRQGVVSLDVLLTDVNTLLNKPEPSP